MLSSSKWTNLSSSTVTRLRIAFFLGILGVFLLQYRYLLQPAGQPCTVQQAIATIKEHDSAGKGLSQASASLRIGAENLAYATLLTGHEEGKDPTVYFQAIRLLAYQLMHKASTRSNRASIIVLVTEDVKQYQVDRIVRDGALVMLARDVTAASNWFPRVTARFESLFAKLRLWQITEYSRIIYLDGDTMLTRSMDGVFDEPGAQPTPLRPNYNATNPHTKTQEAIPPKGIKEYLLASIQEARPGHPYPPSIDNGGFRWGNYFNAGFFIMQPCELMYSHFMETLRLPSSFPPRYAEQSYLNVLYRRDGTGSIPWTPIGNTWNVKWPLFRDVQGGVASIHDKFWAVKDPGLKSFADAEWAEMQAFYETWDLTHPNVVNVTIGRTDI